MMAPAAFSLLGAEQLEDEAPPGAERFMSGALFAAKTYFVRWIVTQPFRQSVRTCLSRWPL